MDTSSSSSASASESSHERPGSFEGKPPLPRAAEEEDHHPQEKEQADEPQQEGDDDAVFYDHEEEEMEERGASSPSHTSIAMKCLLAGIFFYAALLQLSSSSSSYTTIPSTEGASGDRRTRSDGEAESPRRRLTAVMGDTIPSYMQALMKELKERKLLFQDTPPEEIKYWFEYTGPLQVRSVLFCYRYTLYVIRCVTCLLLFVCCVCVVFGTQKTKGCFSLSDPSLIGSKRENEREKMRDVSVP